MAIGVVCLFVVSGAASAMTVSSYAWKEISHEGNINIAYSNNVYDPEVGTEVMLASPYTSNNISTFALENGKWVNLHVNTPQNAGYCAGFSGPMLVYDTSDRYLLLVDAFHPYCGDEPSATAGASSHVMLWKFEGMRWSFIPTAGGPLVSYRSSPLVLYDLSDGYILFAGGDQPAQDWSYQGGVWNKLPAAPVTVDNPILYDSAIGKVLMISSGYWTFHAGTWARIFPADRPNANEATSAGYDPHLQALWVQISIPNALYGDWLWKDGESGFVNITAQTQNPFLVCDAAATALNLNYDPTLKALVCQGSPENGGSGYGLWEFT
ncbi:MAG: hypothetical protein ACREEC_04340 [Thermoplasmata archaeon]